MTTKRSLLLLAGALGLIAGTKVEAQTTPGPQPNICTRACWAARAPNCGLTTSSALTRAIVHHTAAASDWNTTSLDTSKAKIRSTQNYHMDTQGWCDIGYHFLVDKLGNIFEGRANSMTSLRRGIHDACNANSFGFTLLGYFHPPYNHVPTTAMLNSYYATIAWRMPSGWSPYGSGTYCSKTVGFLDGHKKVVATACPGDNIHPNLITENYWGGPMRTAIANLRNPASYAPVRGTPPHVLVEPDGRLIVFAIHTGGSVQYREQSGPSQPFGSWISLGGSSFTNIRAVHANNRFYVFGSGDGGPAYWNYQSAPAGAFSGWVNLGGTFDKVKPVALPDGRLAMFATGAATAVSFQVQTAVGNSWPGWSSLGGSGFNVIDGFCLSNGSLGVVGTGAGNAYVNYQTSPGGAWTGWINVGGTGITYVRAVVMSDDRVALFGNNGGFGNPGSCFVQVQGSVNGAFPGWTSLGGTGFTQIAPCRYADNRLAFFATGPSSTPYYQYQSTPGGAWSGWSTPGGSSFGGIDATIFATDKLIVFGHGGSGGPLLYNYVNSSYAWAGWTDLGGSLIY